MIAFLDYEKAKYGNLRTTRHVERTPEADYAFRTTMPREAFVDVLGEIGRAVDYDNFKNACGDRGAPRVWLTALHKIWSILFTFQDRTDAMRGHGQ